MRILLLLFVLVSLPAFGNLRIYHIDVEQADATLISARSGERKFELTGGHQGRSRTIERIGELAVEFVAGYTAQL